MTLELIDRIARIAYWTIGSLGWIVIIAFTLWVMFRD